MGKSALRYMLKRTPVAPATGTPRQPAYHRAGFAIQTSKRLKWHQQCVAAKMAGASGSRMDIRRKFAEASKACKAENPYK